jgi:hypothetical protein
VLRNILYNNRKDSNKNTPSTILSFEHENITNSIKRFDIGQGRTVAEDNFKEYRITFTIQYGIYSLPHHDNRHYQHTIQEKTIALNTTKCIKLREGTVKRNYLLSHQEQNTLRGQNDRNNINAKER